jgi:hypothetical protein
MASMGLRLAERLAGITEAMAPADVAMTANNKILRHS